MWQVAGQARAVSFLERSLRAPAHAYLFVGPPHVGKMTLALNLAQALNCSAAGCPCGECVSCRKIALAGHADVQIIGLGENGNSSETGARTEIGIGQIQEIQHSASLPPFEGSCKVFIVDGAERLSVEAANCLLKTLEEPLSRVVFVLLTTNERLLPETVVSRCQRLELLPLPADEVEAALSTSWGVESPKSRLLARLCHGCLGWAISAALDDDLLRQRAEKLDELLGIVNADYEERFAYASQLAAQFGRSRASVQEILALWLDWWRDLLLVKAGRREAVTNIDRLDALSDWAAGYSLEQIRSFIEAILMAGEGLRLNANPRLVLEVMMLDIPGREGAITYG